MDYVEYIKKAIIETISEYNNVEFLQFVYTMMMADLTSSDLQETCKKLNLQETLQEDS